MLFDYRCHECGHAFEADFRIGHAEKQVECPECQGIAKRAYTTCNFQLKGGGWPSKKERFNKEMTKRNERAGQRMRKEHGDPPLKPVAYDYGNGDVREAKEG